MYPVKHEWDGPPEKRKSVQFVQPSEAPLQPEQKPAPLRPKKRVARPKPAGVQITPTLVQRKLSLGTRNTNAYANFLFLVLKMLLGAALGFVILACGWFIGAVLSAP
jgi:hypothetical protein